MAPLVIPSDFGILPYLIPNTNTPDVSDQLTLFIAKEQEEILKKLLGKLLYKAFDLGLSIDPIDQRWLNIRDGAEFGPDNERTWGGLKQMLIPYIYHQWLLRTFDQHTDIGITISQAENSEVINPSRRLVDSWNDFQSKVGCFYQDGIYGFIYYSDNVYTDVITPKYTDIQNYTSENMYFVRRKNIFSL